MDSSDVCILIVLVVLLYLSSFFSSSETALTTVNRHRLRSMADDGNKKAQLVLDILEDQNKMLSAILIGNNIVNLTASSLTTVLATKIGGSLAVGIGTGILTFIVLIFGEVGPKTMATIRSEKISFRYAPAIRLCMIVLTPLIILVNALARVYLFVLRVDPNQRDDAMTEEELRTIVEVSHEEGVIESEEKEMITNVFDLGDSQAKDVMVPRVDVVFASVACTYEEILDIFREEHFTRIPVYDESPDDVIGIINMKDLILYKQDTPFSMQDYLREAYFTHEFKNTYELFVEMKKASMTMSIVLDEYGSTVGIITMEDILEEIVGEIRDEFDEEELDDVKEIRNHEYTVAGSYKLDDLNDEIGTEFESEDYDSIGGYLIGLLDHLPEQGEEFTTEDGYRFVAEVVDRNRIETVHLYLPDDFEDRKKREWSDEDKAEE